MNTRMLETRKASGFTLIELMIVVAIIGILAAVAIPQYSDYTQRSEVAGAVAGASAFKLGVSMCFQETGTLTGCDGGVGNIPANITSNNGATINYIDAISTANGTITMTTTATDGTNNLTIIMAPTVTGGALNWALSGTGCTTTGRSINC